MLIEKQVIVPINATFSYRFEGTTLYRFVKEQQKSKGSI